MKCVTDWEYGFGLDAHKLLQSTSVLPIKFNTSKCESEPNALINTDNLHLKPETHFA